MIDKNLKDHNLDSVPNNMSKFRTISLSEDFHNEPFFEVKCSTANILWFPGKQLARTVSYWLWSGFRTNWGFTVGDFNFQIAFAERSSSFFDSAEKFRNTSHHSDVWRISVKSLQPRNHLHRVRFVNSTSTVILGSQVEGGDGNVYRTCNSKYFTPVVLRPFQSQLNGTCRWGADNCF